MPYLPAYISTSIDGCIHPRTSPILQCYHKRKTMQIKQKEKCKGHQALQPLDMSDSDKRRSNTQFWGSSLSAPTESDALMPCTCYLPRHIEVITESLALCMICYIFRSSFLFSSQFGTHTKSSQVDDRRRKWLPLSPIQRPKSRTQTAYPGTRITTFSH